MCVCSALLCRRQEKQRQAQELQAKEDNLVSHTYTISGYVYIAVGMFHSQQQRLKQEESAVEAERRREREESQRQRVQVFPSAVLPSCND